VNFRLHSIPRCTQSFTLSAPAVAPLATFLLTLLHQQLCTVAIQLRGTAEEFHLDIQLASLPEVLRTQADLLESLARVDGLSPASATTAVWDFRQQLLAHDLVCKATMLPSEIAAFAERVRNLGGESVTQAIGIMTAGFPAGAVEHLPQLRRELEAAGGSLMVLKQTAERKLDCWGALPDSLPLMREVKRRFDPEGVLNPGRFLGGM
jgi:glycolate oxidase FAD binding subunit